MRKFILFIFSFIVVCSLFAIKVNAAVTGVTVQSATASSDDDELTIEIVVKATTSADYTSTYIIDVNTLINHYNIEYLEEEHSIRYANESTPNNKLTYNGTTTFLSQSNAIEFVLVQSNVNVLYYITVTIVVDEGTKPNGDVSSYLPLSSRAGGGPAGGGYTPPTVESVFSTTASIVMNSTSGKGTLSGSISFASNTYLAGWYAMDLNYIKEYYGFKVNLSSATLSCSSNSTLNSAMAGSVNIDSAGNVFYFALPSLSSITATINYTATFGEAGTGSNISDAGSRVKIIRITNNVTTQAMAFSAENYSYIVNVDEPKTIEQIITQTGLKAYDHLDGEKTVAYTDTDSYASKVSSVNTVKSRTLGNYNVSFNASDAKSNNTSLVIKLIVKDLSAPTINTSSSTLSYQKSYSDALMADSTLISGIVATDNYADSANLTISVDSTAYKNGYNHVGNYNVPVTVTDPSGNVANGNIVVRVVDSVAPVFSGASSFSTSYTSDISAEEIVEKCGITANDALDGAVSVSISTDGYTAHKNEPGSYDIIVMAQDNSHNVAYFTIHVTVTDNITPYFLVNKTTLVVENGYAYTPEEILEAAISSGIIRTGYTDIEVIEDEYTDNEQTEGTYLYRLKVTYEDNVEYVDINLQVIGSNQSVVKLKWYAKIGNFFTRTFQKIGHFFSDIVYEKGIKKVFDFVKNTWNKIFRR